MIAPIFSLFEIRTKYFKKRNILAASCGERLLSAAEKEARMCDIAAQERIQNLTHR